MCFLPSVFQRGSSPEGAFFVKCHFKDLTFLLISSWLASKETFGKHLGHSWVRRTLVPKLLCLHKSLTGTYQRESLPVWASVSCGQPWIFGFGNESKKKKRIHRSECHEVWLLRPMVSLFLLKKPFRNYFIQTWSPKTLSLGYAEVWGKVSCCPSPRTPMYEADLLVLS